jgi:hypothetical protein
VHAADGWGHFVGKLAQAGGPESVSVRSTISDEEAGLQEMLYHKPGSYLPARGLQWIEEESGYKFSQRGEPFAFERKLHSDPKQRIATRSDVLRFVRELGVDLEDENFWTSDCDAVYLRETWKKTETNK